MVKVSRFQLAGCRAAAPHPEPTLRRGHDAVGSLAHPNRHVIAARRKQPPVIPMAMGEQDAKQRRVRLTQAGHVRQQCRRVSVVRRIERQPEIDDKPRPLNLTSTQEPPICSAPRKILSRKGSRTSW